MHLQQFLIWMVKRQYVMGSCRDMKRMMTDLAQDASKYGLKIHAGKTLVLTNAPPPRLVCTPLQGGLVQVLDIKGSQKYLGRKLSIDDLHQTELSNRIACGWRVFV